MLPFGSAHVFYPEASDERCTAALQLDVDPVGLVRRGVRFARLDQYVNDRPCVASSFMSVALSRVFNTALAGRCVRSLSFPRRCCRWRPGAARPADAPLRADPRPRRAKHYWVGDEEVEKLLARGEGWLANHPDRELIVNRYLKYQRPLARAALEQLLADQDPAVDADAAEREAEEEAVEEPLRLNEKRHAAVVAAVRGSGATRVLDLGCGSGKLLRALMDEPSLEKIVGVDISYAALETAKSRLRLDRLAPRQRERIELFETALAYRDRRLAGFDAAAVVEVIEHLEEPRLRSFEWVLFGHARPKTVIVTTPNREYNAKFEGLPTGRFR